MVRIGLPRCREGVLDPSNRRCTGSTKRPLGAVWYPILIRGGFNIIGRGDFTFVSGDPSRSPIRATATAVGRRGA